jgi:hypothetical protein
MLRLRPHSRRTDMQLDKVWYTTALNQLMREDADAGAAQCGVGFLNFDPLTNAQNDVASYALGAPRARGDSALVPVRIHNGYPPPTGTDEQMTVAMVREAGRWRIANFIHTDWNLASSLQKSVAEWQAAPPAGCSTPESGKPSSPHADSAVEPPRSPQSSPS